MGSRTGRGRNRCRVQGRAVQYLAVTVRPCLACKAGIYGTHSLAQRVGGQRHGHSAAPACPCTHGHACMHPSSSPACPIPCTPDLMFPQPISNTPHAMRQAGPSSCSPERCDTSQRGPLRSSLLASPLPNSLPSCGARAAGRGGVPLPTHLCSDDALTPAPRHVALLTYVFTCTPAWPWGANSLGSQAGLLRAPLSVNRQGAHGRTRGHQPQTNQWRC